MGEGVLFIVFYYLLSNELSMILGFIWGDLVILGRVFFDIFKGIMFGWFWGLFFRFDVVFFSYLDDWVLICG